MEEPILEFAFVIPGLIPNIINPDEALVLHRSGVEGFRIPGLRSSSVNDETYVSRGMQAAMHVLNGFPYSYDSEGRRLSEDPERLKVHMLLGLSAIQTAGRRPLTDKFVQGYQTTIEMFTDPDVIANTVEL